MGQECTKVHNTSIALYKLQNVFLEGTDSRKISSLINSIKYNFIKYIKYDTQKHKDEHIYILHLDMTLALLKFFYRHTW